MNLDVNKLVEEHGQRIADQLRIATEQVYDKVMWYIRIDGAVNLVKGFLSLIFFVIWSLAARWYLKNARKWDFFEYDDGFGFMMVGLIIFAFGGLFGGLLWSSAVDYFVTSLSMIVAPEYYLIKQIVEGIANQ